jgi:hypothetical protein
MGYELREEYHEAIHKKINKVFRRFGHRYKEYDVREEVAKRYGFSGRQLARLLRINQLSDALKVRLDAGEFCFTAGVDLSFLSEEQQKHVDEAIADGAKVDIKNSGKLKEMAGRRTEAKTRIVNRENIRRVLLGSKRYEELEKKEEETEEAEIEKVEAEENAEEEQYIPVTDYNKYLRDNFPRYFDNTPDEEMEPKDLYIRYMINFYVKLDGALRYFYPKFFKAKEHFYDVMGKIYSATIAYYDMLSTGALG